MTPRCRMPIWPNTAGIVRHGHGRGVDDHIVILLHGLMHQFVHDTGVEQHGGVLNTDRRA